jgi:glycosyltransferase involved in cell wall biosynthesis
MSSVPIISVLMPVYNGEKYLSEAIKSILNQTFTDFEFLFINDGSTDQSKIIIDSFHDPRIVYIENEQNNGLIYSLNLGISLAKGKYIARMDADDISLPKRLEKQVNYLEQHKDIGICGASAYRIDGNGNVLGKMGRIRNPQVLQASLIFSSPFIHPLMMIRTELIADNMYDPRYKHVEDYELWTRLLIICKGINLNDYLLLYRWHDENISVVQNEIQKQLTKEIALGQLCAVGINANDEDYKVHLSTFTDEKINFDKLGMWFSRILDANKKTSYYNQTALTALLYSRWILASLRTRQIQMLLKWRWLSFRILRETLSILKEKR